MKTNTENNFKKLNEQAKRLEKMRKDITFLNSERTKLISKILDRVEEESKKELSEECLGVLEQILEDYTSDIKTSISESKDIKLECLSDSFIYYSDAFKYLEGAGFCNNFQGYKDALDYITDELGWHLDPSSDSDNLGACDLARIMLESEVLDAYDILEEIVEDYTDEVLEIAEIIEN